MGIENVPGECPRCIKERLEQRDATVFVRLANLSVASVASVARATKVSEKSVCEDVRSMFSREGSPFSLRSEATSFPS